MWLLTLRHGPKGPSWRRGDGQVNVHGEACRFSGRARSLGAPVPPISVEKTERRMPSDSGFAPCFSLDFPECRHESENLVIVRKRILALLVVMVGVATAVSSLAIWVLYEAAFEQQREQLENLAKHQARMLDSSTRFELSRSGANRLGNPDAPTIGEILRIHNTHESFGQTGEYVIGQREVELITFLLPYRFPERANREPARHGRDRGFEKIKALQGDARHSRRRAFGQRHGERYREGHESGFRRLPHKADRG